VQPQWVADCLNLRFQLPVERYRPGASLPPHLSPFVDDAAEGYVPAYRSELDALKSAAEEYGNSAASKLPASGAAAAQVGDGDADKENDEEDDDEEGAESGEDDEEEEAGESEDDGEDGEGDEAARSADEGTPVAKPVSEEKQLALTMMSKKAKRLYDRMQHGLSKRSGAVDDLKRKRKAAEAKAAVAVPAAPAKVSAAAGNKSKKGKK
jgi:pescadillo protein